MCLEVFIHKHKLFVNPVQIRDGSLPPSSLSRGSGLEEIGIPERYNTARVAEKAEEATVNS